jgi:hypothetical protein
VKLRRLREGDVLDDGGVVLVRGGDEDGQVHFTVLPGSLEKNRHLIGRDAA